MESAVTARVAVLAILLDGESSINGILDKISKRTRGAVQLRHAGISTALNAMRKEGLIQSFRGATAPNRTGPGQQHFRLTDEGLRLAIHQRTIISGLLGDRLEIGESQILGAEKVLREFKDRDGESVFIDPSAVTGIKSSWLKGFVIVEQKGHHSLQVAGTPRTVARSLLITSDDRLNRSEVVEALTIEYRKSLSAGYDVVSTAALNAARVTLLGLAARINIDLDKELLNTPIEGGE